MSQPLSLKERFKNLIIGRPHNLNDKKIFHNLSLVAFFAWVGLGADGLSSSCYGPQEAFLALGSHAYLSVFVAIGTVLTIFVISASYSQIAELFPTGGGGYFVASKLLSPGVGMVSGCALLIDYVLTITVSIASGADAVFSLLPLQYQTFKLSFAVFSCRFSLFFFSHTFLLFFMRSGHICRIFMAWPCRRPRTHKRLFLKWDLWDWHFWCCVPTVWAPELIRGSRRSAMGCRC
jgi:hypothetical protein